LIVIVLTLIGKCVEDTEFSEFTIKKLESVHSIPNVTPVCDVGDISATRKYVCGVVVSLSFIFNTTDPLVKVPDDTNPSFEPYNSSPLSRHIAIDLISPDRHVDAADLFILTLVKVTGPESVTIENFSIATPLCP